MMMPRLNRVFRSRWSALWWAGGILLLAWRVAAAGDIVPLNSARTAAPPPADPWALDPQ